MRMNTNGHILLKCYLIGNSFPTRLLSCCTDKYAHTYDVSTGKSSESVQCAMLKACDACADMGQL